MWYIHVTEVLILGPTRMSLENIRQNHRYRKYIRRSQGLREGDPGVTGYTSLLSDEKSGD